MPDTGRKIPVKVRLIVTIAIATAVAVTFHMLEAPLNKAAILGLTAVAAVIVELFAFVYVVMSRQRVARP